MRSTQSLVKSEARQHSRFEIFTSARLLRTRLYVSSRRSSELQLVQHGRLSTPYAPSSMRAPERTLHCATPHGTNPVTPALEPRQFRRQHRRSHTCVVAARDATCQYHAGWRACATLLRTPLQRSHATQYVWGRRRDIGTRRVTPHVEVLAPSPHAPC